MLLLLLQPVLNFGAPWSDIVLPLLLLQLLPARAVSHSALVLLPLRLCLLQAQGALLRQWHGARLLR